MSEIRDQVWIAYVALVATGYRRLKHSDLQQMMSLYIYDPKLHERINQHMSIKQKLDQNQMSGLQ